jgi:hypothetical protein
MINLTKWLRRPRQSKPETTTPSASAIALIATLLEGHGVVPRRSEGILAFQGGWSLATEVFREEQHPNGRRSAQLDVRLQLPDGRVLIESCAGIGDDSASVVKDAVENFMRGSLHVLLHAFWLSEPDEQVDIENWIIGENGFHAVMGGATGRGTQPSGGIPLGWFATFEDAVKSSRLSPTTHWIRVYYAQVQGQPMAVEVLFDNEPWVSVQQIIQNIEWPQTEEFYSVRFFMVLVPAA